MSVHPTAQVCVIDDEPREYLPLVHALNALRMGCVLVRGDRVEELPPAPLKHLRLVFLDMHLGTNGGMDDTAVANQTANVFSRVVSPTSAPIAVVVWTKYAHLVASFRAALLRALPVFESGLFFLRIDKPALRTRIDKDDLKRRVEEELKKLEPLSVLWGWNMLIQRAACDVTAELCRLAFKQASPAVGDDENAARTKMLAALGEVLRRLLVAEAGRALTAENAPASLLNILSPLHADRLEHGSTRNEIEAVQSLLRSIPEDIAPSSEVRVGLNTMLLTGSADASGQPFRPGSVCLVENATDFEAAFGLSTEEIGKALYRKPTPGKEREHAERFAAWFASCRPVVLEISPNCDFAQQKRPIARFLVGVFVPSSARKEVEQATKEEGYSARRMLVQAVKVATLDDATEWHPVFWSALILSWPERKTAPFLKPICRLKEPVMSDIRNWLSHQGARPGYSSVD